MARQINGTLITCDAAVREIILELNESRNFIIDQVDGTHLFVKPEMVDTIKYEVQQILDQNAFKVEMEGVNVNGSGNSR